MTREELERDQQNIQAELEEADETLAPHPFGSAGVSQLTNLPMSQTEHRPDFHLVHWLIGELAH